MNATASSAPLAAAGLLTVFLLGCGSNATDVAPADAAAAPAEAAAAPAPPPAPAPSAAEGSAPKEPGSQPAGDAEAADATQAPAAEIDEEQLAADLASEYSVVVFAAAERFRRLPAEQRREILAKLSAHESANVRDTAWRAFATWATRDDVPTLIAALESPHDDVRSAALALLAEFPNEQTIGVLTKALETPELRERATALLVRVGPAAEGALLTYSDHADAGLRHAAWNILGQIGLRKSLLALQQLSTREPFQKEEELKRAMEEIRQRLRK